MNPLVTRGLDFLNWLGSHPRLYARWFRGLQVLDRPPRPGERILLYLLGRMGDVVLSTRLLAPMRQAFPDAYIAFGTQCWYRDLVRNHPGIDEIRYLVNLEEVRRNAGEWDRMVCLHIVDRHNAREFEGLLPDWKERMEGPSWWESGCHLVEIYNQIAHERAGVIVEPDAKSDVVVSETDRQYVRELLRTRIGEVKEYAIFHLRTERLKTWPPENFRSLRAALQKTRPDLPILVLGGKDDPRIEGPRVVHLQGRISLGQCAAVLSEARLFVGQVSGLMHLADAMGTPSVVLFGSEIPEWGGPRHCPSICIQSPTTCDPPCCFPCHQPSFCIDDIPVDLVESACEEMLRLGSPDGRGFLRAADP